MKKIIEIEYPDYNLKEELAKFVDELCDADGRMKDGVYRSHIIIEHVPNL